jgi:hypothetical protein
MNIIDLRKGPRRSLTTPRVDERRKVVHEFGSPEWLEYVQENQVDCPMTDRRKEERAAEKRQLSDRREQFAETPVDSIDNYTRIYLTPAEKEILQDLYLDDL